VKAEILSILPLNVRELVQRLNPVILDKMEELRIRENRPLEIIYDNKHIFLTPKGSPTLNVNEAYLPTNEDTFKMLNLISNHSLYRLEEELKRGYITVNGGHRVGIVGKAVIENGEVRTIKDITSFNIRIAKQIIGAANGIIKRLINKNEKQVYNTLIISPPQCGKTTLLRDIARQLSEGIPNYLYSGKKVGIVDERSEIAGCVQGVPQNNVGPRTDVMDSCPKATGMMMMIRSMSPDVLIIDEIGRQEDSQAILEARNAGVQIIATAHGSSLNDMTKRPSVSSLIQQEIFQRYIILSKKGGVGTIEKILDGQLNPIEWKEKNYV